MKKDIRKKPAGKRRSKGFIRKRKKCRFCTDKFDNINYKDVSRLERFVTERGKILPSRISGTCAWHQRRLAREIKKARAIALLPFIANYR